MKPFYHASKLMCSASSASLVAIASSALAAFAPSASFAQHLPPAGVADLSEYLEQAVEETHIPGIVAVVATANEVLYSGAFGERNLAEELPMTTDTIFRIASMTKPVTSVAVMMLVEEGKVALDDPIGKYLPDLAGKEVIATFDFDDNTYTTRPAEREITIRHLLTHTSGFGYAFSNEILNALVGGTPGASVQGQPLLHDPGERWTYGESTRVLGALVEKVSGRALDELMLERIFTPLGMTETSYAVPAPKNARVATLHTGSDGGLVETPNPDVIGATAYGDGGLHSTAADYVKFAQMLLRGGVTPDGTRLLREETVESMGRNHIGDLRVSLQPAARAITRPFPLGAGRDSFGLGFQITEGPREPDMRAPGSMSWAGLFNTEFWIDPEEGIAAVLLMQYLPFYDEAALATLQGFEQRVYRHLER